MRYGKIRDWDKVYILESNRDVRKVEVIRCSGAIYHQICGEQRNPD